MARTGIPTGGGGVVNPDDSSDDGDSGSDGSGSSSRSSSVDYRDIGGDPAGDADRDTSGDNDGGGSDSDSDSDSGGSGGGSQDVDYRNLGGDPAGDADRDTSGGSSDRDGGSDRPSGVDYRNLGGDPAGDAGRDAGGTDRPSGVDYRNIGGDPAGLTGVAAATDRAERDAVRQAAEERYPGADRIEIERTGLGQYEVDPWGVGSGKELTYEFDRSETLGAVTEQQSKVSTVDMRALGGDPVGVTDEQIEQAMKEAEARRIGAAGGLVGDPAGRPGDSTEGVTFTFPALNLGADIDQMGAEFGISEDFEQRDLGDRPIEIPSWIESIGDFETGGDARLEDYLEHEAGQYEGWASGVDQRIDKAIPLLGSPAGAATGGVLKAFNPAGAALVGKELLETGDYLASGEEPAGERIGAVAGQAGPVALGSINYAYENPFEFLGGVGAGLVTGIGLSKIGTAGRGFLRTIGGKEIPETDLVNTKALDEGSPFPGAEDPTLYRDNPAGAVESQAAKYTNPEIEARFSQAGAEGTTLKKALDVEPDSPGFGRGGFKSPEASGQVYESPGSFFGPELSKYFLRVEEPGYSLRPGLPSLGGKPTGVLAKVDVENTQAVDLAGFNRELIERSGEPVAITKPGSAVAVDEIEAVVPPSARFSAVSDTGPLNRLGIGSDFYTRIGGRRVPGTDIEVGGRRVPLRLVEPEADAGSAAAAVDDLAADARPLSYYSGDLEPTTYRPLPAIGGSTGDVFGSSTDLDGVGSSGRASPSGGDDARSFMESVTSEAPRVANPKSAGSGSSTGGGGGYDWLSGGGSTPPGSPTGGSSTPPSSPSGGGSTPPSSPSTPPTPSVTPPSKRSTYDFTDRKKKRQGEDQGPWGAADRVWDTDVAQSLEELDERLDKTGW